MMKLIGAAMPRQKVTLKPPLLTVDLRRNYKQSGSLATTRFCCELGGRARCAAAHPASSWLVMKPRSESRRSVPTRQLPSLVRLKRLWQTSGSRKGDDGQADFWKPIGGHFGLMNVWWITSSCRSCATFLAVSQLTDAEKTSAFDETILKRLIRLIEMKYSSIFYVGSKIFDCSSLWKLSR